MSIRKHPTKGAGWWIIDYYPQGRKGRREQIPFQGNEAEARAAEAACRLQLKTTPTSLFPKISEVVPEFVESYRLDHQPAGTQRTLFSLKQLLPFFGAMQFTSLAPAIIDKYKSSRLSSGVTPSTINKELSALSSMCRWAHQKGYCPRIEIKRFPPKLTRAPLPMVPSPADVQRLLDAIPAWKRGMFAAMYYGGLRRGEAFGLKAENINLAARVMVIRGKGNKQRVVPISQNLESFLRERIEKIGGIGYLWLSPLSGKPYKDVRQTLNRAAKRAGLEHAYPHLLRHCFGAHGTAAGIGLRSLQLMMGHSTSQITEIYTQMIAAGLIAEMDKFPASVVKKNLNK